LRLFLVPRSWFFVVGVQKSLQPNQLNIQNSTINILSSSLRCRRTPNFNLNSQLQQPFAPDLVGANGPETIMRDISYRAGSLRCGYHGCKNSDK